MFDTYTDVIIVWWLRDTRDGQLKTKFYFIQFIITIILLHIVLCQHFKHQRIYYQYKPI